MNCGLVAVKGASLCPVQNEVAQFMCDGEPSTLWAGVRVVEDPPLGRIIGIANQHPFNTAHGRCHWGLDDFDPFTVGRCWQPLPNPVEINVRSLLLIGDTHPTQDHVRRFAWSQV